MLIELMLIALLRALARPDPGEMVKGAGADSFDHRHGASHRGGLERSRPDDLRQAPLRPSGDRGGCVVDFRPQALECRLAELGADQSGDDGEWLIKELHSDAAYPLVSDPPLGQQVARAMLHMALVNARPFEYLVNGKPPLRRSTHARRGSESRRRCSGRSAAPRVA